MIKTLPKRPLVDVTCVNAAESLLRGGPLDPAAESSAIAFADYYVFAVQPRYALPVPAEAQEIDRGIPTLLEKILGMKRNVMNVEKCLLDFEQRHLSPDYLRPSFECFSGWARKNMRWLRAWLQVHHEDWIRKRQWETNLPSGFLYNVETLDSTGLVRPLAFELGDPYTVHDVYYAFDVVLRYPLYGEAAGPDTYYLSHPVREQQDLPTFTARDIEPPWVPASIGELIQPIIGSLNIEQYCRVLADTRTLLESERIVDYTTGHVDLAGFDDFLERVRLTVRLRRAEQTLQSLGTALTMLGEIPALGVPARLAGSAIGLASSFWDGKVPKKLGTIRWLRWAYRWGAELKEPRKANR